MHAICTEQNKHESLREINGRRRKKKNIKLKILCYTIAVGSSGGRVEWDTSTDTDGSQLRKRGPLKWNTCADVVTARSNTAAPSTLKGILLLLFINWAAAVAVRTFVTGTAGGRIRFSFVGESGSMSSWSLQVGQVVSCSSHDRKHELEKS